MTKKEFPVVALMGNPQDSRVVESLRTLAEYLKASGIAVIIAEALGKLALGAAVQSAPEVELTSRANLVVTIGGDGSMLYASRCVAGSDVPLLGINRGRLGFLADVSPSDMIARIDEIMRGEYETETRLLLRAEVIEDNNILAGGLALNDIVVSRHDPGRMLEIKTLIDGRYVNTHRGDGFIIATATGSTAYALSCGGPIVSPSLDAIVLVPICPHTLSERPILVPATALVEIMLSEAHSTRADVICDGETTAALLPGRRLRVRAADERVQLIHPRGYDYFHILRTKLQWGRDHQTQRGISH